VLLVRARRSARSARPQLLTTRTRTDAWLAGAAGLGYVGVALVARRHEERWEAEALEGLNGELGRRPLLWLAQQFGTPWVLPGVAAIAFWRRQPHLAVAAALALPVEKALEVGIKKVVRRRRPAQSPHDTRLRDDAPADGPSYPSGHAAIAFAATTLLAPHTKSPLTALLGLGGVLVGIRRVQQGAHFPLDSVGGALLGVAVGAGLRYVVGGPSRLYATATG
jgi:membrane-associated phospholipid phosphatase